MSRIQLRPYQRTLKDEVIRAFEYARAVLLVLATGAGKTVIFSDIIRDHDGPCVAIAHRQELVSQISQALARDEVFHRIIGPDEVIRICVNNHMEELGASFFRPDAPCAVAGVKTILTRADQLNGWRQGVTQVVHDEAHHLLTENQFGKAVRHFPNARVLGVTATEKRADGKGLGAHADGVFETMINGDEFGAGMRDLIDAGHLADYQIYAPPNDLDLSDVSLGKDGDYSKMKLKKAVRRSHIVGDVVQHYRTIADAKLGVTFATDVETATDIAAQFNEAGVPAAVVSAKTPIAERERLIRRFRNRELHQLVNVDLFGEGFDVPGIEVVSMARPTQSFAVYCQQFGRALRILPTKWVGDRYLGIIIDHVGNVFRHGLPDAPRVRTLDRRERRASGASDAIPVTSCPSCTRVYERVTNTCPFCGFSPVPSSRSNPEFVDGDLTELDEDTLKRMRGAVASVDLDKEVFRARCIAKGVPRVGEFKQVIDHVERQEAQAVLRETILLWAGRERHVGRLDPEIYRRFYFKFGVDVLTAQALGRKDAEALNGKIREDYER